MSVTLTEKAAHEIKRIIEDQKLDGNTCRVNGLILLSFTPRMRTDRR